MGSDFLGGTVTREHVVSPSDSPTIVSISSSVVSTPAQRMNSPEYLATVRRRKAKTIGVAVAGLEKRAGGDDFEAYTYKIVEDIRALLIQLSEIHREGNTREILRQIRDTFMDGGHSQYKAPLVRKTVATILETLSVADEVTAEDVDRTWDLLFDRGIRASIPPIVVVEGE